MIKLRIARKDQKCAICGRRIPKGAKYWIKAPKVFDASDVIIKEHTNCLEFEKEPKL